MWQGEYIDYCVKVHPVVDECVCSKETNEREEDEEDDNHKFHNPGR